MGFCSRCGELINGQNTRCRCGGLPRNASVQVSPVSQKDGNTDRWSRTYTSKDKSPSPANSPSTRTSHQRNSGSLPPLGMLNMDFNKDDDISPPPRTPPPSDALGTSHTNLAALPPVQRSPGRRTFPKPLNHSSRISSRSATNSRPSSPLKQSYAPVHNSPPSSREMEPVTDDDIPTIADESELGDLTNTLGSTIQPKDSLPVQLCAGCDTPFATDAVRYPGLDDPRGVTGIFYCRPCFKDNGGLKGYCAACGNEVLMGRHDGSSVTVRDQLFHSKCFKCSYCGTKVERGHSCDPAGKPCCEPCLDKVLNTSSPPAPPPPPPPPTSSSRSRRKSGSAMGTGESNRGTPHTTPRNSSVKKSSPAPTTPGSGNRPRESMSFLEELKQRQTAGGTPSPSAIRRETIRSRSKSRDQDRSRDTDHSRDGDRSHDTERDASRSRGTDRDNERQRRESSPISPINPDMIRRDTMGPRKVGSALRHRAREREREQSASPSPAARRASRDTGASNGDKPSPRSAMRSASRPRERSVSPPGQRSTKFADTPPLKRSTSKSALKQRDRSVSPGTYRGRPDEGAKPAPRSALRSASRVRTSDPKARRERERSTSPPPTNSASSTFPVGKLTRDLGSLSIGLSSVDDSNVSTSDSRSSIAPSDWTALSSTSTSTSLRSSMSPPSGSGPKPALKTRRSATALRESIVESTDASESPSTLARMRRPLRSQTSEREKTPTSEKPDAFRSTSAASLEEDEFIGEKDTSMEKEEFKPSTPSRIARRSAGRDSPASTGTVTPSGTRTRPSITSSGKKMTMGDYHDTEEHRTSWLKNRESRTRSFVASSPRGDFSDTSTDSLAWSKRREKLDDGASSRPASIVSQSTDFEAFSPPPAAPSTSSPATARRRVQVDDLVMPIDSTERCYKCNEKLHLDGGNMFVTVPGYAKTGNTGEFTPARTFHVDCFKCSVCELPFGGEAWEGQQARFVQLKDVIAHPECAPPIVRTATYTPIPSKVNRAVRSVPQPAEPPMRSAPARDYAISRPSHTSTVSVPTNAVTAAPANRPRSGTTGQAPRFGGSMYCPWCGKSVSPMELGTCPGPNGSRWHSSCLVCGGKDAKKNRKNPKDPGCGKQLDSGAKSDHDGGVWCRECIDKLPAEMRPSSPIKPLVPTHTGNRPLSRAGGALTTQYTGVSVHTTGGGGILRPQTTGGGGIIRPQTTGGGGIIRPQTTGGGGIIRPQTTGGGGILKPQTTGGGGILKPQTTGGGGILKSQTTGGAGYVRPQFTGRSTGEIHSQFTGGRGVPAQYTGGSMVGALVPQLTGGVPITMQLTGGMLRSRSPTKGFSGELEEQVTGSGRPVSMIGGKGDFQAAMALARKGVSMDEPVRERPKSVYGTRNWKM